jgi:hypothetical protein
MNMANDNNWPDDFKSEAGGADPIGDAGLRGKAADFMKKAMTAGVGALFLTEEGIRNLVGDLKLPKELLTSLVTQADRTKQDIVRTLGEEVRRFLESAAVHEELHRLLSDVTLEVKAEVRLRPGKAPEVVGSPQVAVKPKAPGKRER